MQKVNNTYIDLAEEASFFGKSCNCMNIAEIKKKYGYHKDAAAKYRYQTMKTRK